MVVNYWFFLPPFHRFFAGKNCFLFKSVANQMFLYFDVIFITN